MFLKTIWNIGLYKIRILSKWRVYILFNPINILLIFFNLIIELIVGEQNVYYLLNLELIRNRSLS